MSTHQLVSVLPWLAILGVMIWGKYGVWVKRKEGAKNELVIFALAALFSFIFTYLLRWILYHRDTQAESVLFLILVVLIEELIKTWATVKAVESGNKWLEERRDGLMYSLGAGLGFVAAIWRFWGEEGFWNQNLIYWAGVNILLVLIFGIYYAVAYTDKKKQVIGSGQKRKQAPYKFLRNMMQAAVSADPRKQKDRDIWSDYRIMLKELIKILTLHVTRKHILRHRPTQGHWSGEVVLEGFVLVFYLHLIALAAVLSAEQIGQSVTLLFVPFLFIVLLIRTRTIGAK